MVFELLAKAIDLANWAETQEAKGRFPELIRRLCFATSQQPHRIEFASGEGTALHGYDGVVEAAGEDTHVPKGRSVWELSSNQNPRTKATADFEKRTLKPDPYVAIDTTYVACTLRQWNKKEDTIADWSTRGWKDACIYDCNSIETWLQRAPAVHLWVSRLLGKQPEGAMDIESYWDNWSRNSKPAIPPEILLVGYDDQATDLITQLQTPARVVKIRAESADFARAFVAAVLATKKGELAESIASRTVVINSPSAWLEVTSQYRRLVLMPAFDASELIGAAVAGYHTVVQGLGQEHRAESDVIHLPQRHPMVLQRVVEQFWQKPDEIMRVCERMASSLSAFRRSIALATTHPNWANPHTAGILMPCLIAGSWGETYEGDKKLVSSLSGLTYDEWFSKLSPWLNVSDPPIRKIGAIFRLVDRRDAWSALSNRLDDNQLARFERVATEALSQPDPRWHPDEEIRRTARFSSDLSGVSTALQSGLADTLALFGALGSDVNTQGNRQADAVAESVVRALFRTTNDVQRLCSMSPYFMRLAEASPSVFLDSIEKVIQDPSYSQALFQDRDMDFFSSRSPHTYLLWALETLAWDPTLLARVTLLLARLDEADPGGSTSNRPFRSLREVFLPWSPKTLASVEDRLPVLDRLRRKCPTTSWKLLLALLPEDHAVSIPTSEALYRPWGRLYLQTATVRDVDRFTEEATCKLLDDVGADANRWSDLVANFPSIDPRQHGRFFNQLEAALGSVPEVGRQYLSSAIRKLVTHNSKFPDATWSLPGDILAKFRTILDASQPEDPMAKWAWLFEKWVDFPDEPLDYDARESKLNELRGQGVTEILSSDELNQFLEFADAVPESGVWGYSVGRNRRLVEEHLLFERNLAPGYGRRTLATRGYIYGRGDVAGIAILDQLWENRQKSPVYEAGLLRCMRLDAVTMQRLSQTQDETRKVFWSEMVLVNELLVEADILEDVVRALLSHGGYASAIRTLALSRRDRSHIVDPAFIIETLEQVVIAAGSNDVPFGKIAYDICELMNLVENVEGKLEKRVLDLEFVFSRLLLYNREPKVSQRFIARNPDVYMQLIRATFMDEDGNIPPLRVNEVELPPENAHEMLKQLRILPGQHGNDVDLDELKLWVTRARELARESRQERMFFSMFGQWLAKSPLGKDGNWPHESVREIIEEIESEKLEDSMQIGITNGRAVYMKSYGEGGDQERALASKYRSWQLALSFSCPRTARVLGRVAETYDEMAIRED